MSIPDNTERTAEVETAGSTVPVVWTSRPGKSATGRGARPLTSQHREVALWVVLAGIAGWIALAHSVVPAEPLWCAAWGIGLVYAARVSSELRLKSTRHGRGAAQLR